MNIGVHDAEMRAITGENTVHSISDIQTIQGHVGRSVHGDRILFQAVDDRSGPAFESQVAPIDHDRAGTCAAQNQRGFREREINDGLKRYFAVAVHGNLYAQELAG